MTERIVYLIMVLVVASWFVSTVARLASPLTVLAVLVLIARWTWWYTR
jgi:hypothetical protein